MLYVNCDVRIGGDNNNIVPKKDVSVAEVAILRHIHGDDAVDNIQSTGRTDTISAVKERERLKTIYKPALVMSVFPGAMPALPTKLEDIVAVMPAGEEGGAVDGGDGNVDESDVQPKTLPPAAKPTLKMPASAAK